MFDSSRSAAARPGEPGWAVGKVERVTDTSWWRPDGDDGIVVFVRATPGAKRDEIVGVAAGRLRVRIAAPPAEGLANDRLCRFVAKAFGVRPSAVSVRRGRRSREKEVCVLGATTPPERLDAAR